ncbi:MAG: GntG family PLP-dependent aldolase [Chloroflexota bacterium]|nr:MAG: hypothetical protein DLM70_15925 [Chloroflexota bacterium]
MTQRLVELRSDTFTRPTESMRLAMYGAEVGDDVWGEDPTAIRLERRAAELMGKEAGLFVSSGTQGNLVAVLSHTRPGQELIVGEQSHIIWYESGGAALIGGLQLRSISNPAGSFHLDQLRATIRVGAAHAAETGCVALENTHNRCGGAVLTTREVGDIADVSHDAGVPVHMDGARIFNAAIALDIPARELARPVDSITFCLSKALGAPVGSLLSGSEDYIERARTWRQRLGGGMRQVGVLAAAGLVALDENIQRLAEDHANARRLAEGLETIDGVALDASGVRSNIVIADVTGLGVPPAEIATRLRELGILLAPAGPNTLRAVTSYEVGAAGVDRAVSAMREVCANLVPVGA